MSRRERKKQATERRILEAALSAMDEKGFAGASMEGIAERADVGVGTLYNYFKSKDELLIAIVASSTEDILEHSRTMVDHPPADPLDGLTDLLVQYARGFHKFEKDLMLELMAVAFARMRNLGAQLMEQDMRLLALLCEMIEGYVERGVLKKGLSGRDAATVLYGNFFIHFTLYLHLREMTVIELEVMLKKANRLVLEGMLPRGGDQ